MKRLNLESGRPKICVSLTATNHAELLEQVEAMNQSSAEIVEWRVDYFEDSDEIDKVVETLIDLKEKLINRLLLFTFRTLEEGGEKAISLPDYKKLYLAVAASKKVDLMDIELARVEFLGRQLIQEIKKQGILVILSSHDFEKTPDDATLIFRIGVMNQLGADIGKIAAMPQEIQDVLRMMGIIAKARGFNQLPLITMSMGDLGKVSRVSGELTGSLFTFGAMDEASAPGQIPVEALAKVLETLSHT
ncbi:type I 3-dehydroquinate dehydratase [Enterococcus sp. LJL98]